MLFLELMMLPQQITMIAGEYDDGIICKPKILERVQNTTNLCIHVGNTGIIGFK